MVAFFALSRCGRYLLLSYFFFRAIYLSIWCFVVLSFRSICHHLQLATLMLPLLCNSRRACRAGQTSRGQLLVTATDRQAAWQATKVSHETRLIAFFCSLTFYCTLPSTANRQRKHKHKQTDGKRTINKRRRNETVTKWFHLPSSIYLLLRPPMCGATWLGQVVNLIAIGLRWDRLIYTICQTNLAKFFKCYNLPNFCALPLPLPLALALAPPLCLSLE